MFDWYVGMYLTGGVGREGGYEEVGNVLSSVFSWGGMWCVEVQ